MELPVIMSFQGKTLFQASGFGNGTLQILFSSYQRNLTKTLRLFLALQLPISVSYTGTMGTSRQREFCHLLLEGNLAYCQPFNLSFFIDQPLLGRFTRPAYDDGAAIGHISMEGHKPEVGMCL